MNKTDKIIFGAFILVVICAIFGVGLSLGMSVVKQDAIQANAGKYIMDHKTGHSKFIWMPAKEPNKEKFLVK